MRIIYYLDIYLKRVLHMDLLIKRLPGRSSAEDKHQQSYKKRTSERFNHD